MPFFNFRKANSGLANAQSNAQPESMEVIRRRAKHRLIGSAVLVLAGVVGFPLLFDTQPRPIAVDMPIEIPSKTSVKPLVAGARPEADPPAPGRTATVGAQSSLTAREEIVAEKAMVPAPAVPAVSTVAPVVSALEAPKKEAKIESKAEPKPSGQKAEAKPEAKPESKAEVRAEAKPELKIETKPDDGVRAKALLDGQSLPAVALAGQERFVVQVGAFADENKAQDVRQKVERAGLKTYTQVAETKDGKRIRVRVGPFASKAEADKAASKIKTLDLPAAILTL